MATVSPEKEFPLEMSDAPPSMSIPIVLPVKLLPVMVAPEAALPRKMAAPWEGSDPVAPLKVMLPLPSIAGLPVISNTPSAPLRVSPLP